MGNLVSAINKTLWGTPMLILLVGCGVYLTIKLGFFQLTGLRDWAGETIGSFFRHKGRTKCGITPYQAISSALASTIGSGNLVGVATAVASGGAGAVFWMWVSAFFGMATKYAEIYLAVKFRIRHGDGFIGGPMYYIEKGLGKGYRWLAVIFSVSGALACLGMGGMNQANSISVILNERLCISPYVTGVILSLVAWMSISGGITRLSRILEMIVPVMALSYIVVCLFIMVSDIDKTLFAVSQIFRAALHPRAVCGAFCGEAIRRAMRFGIARGVFSNEAGLGSSPIVHAAADAKSPESQGYWGAFEVFADTMVMCTMTAIIIIGSGVDEGIEGVSLVSAAFGSYLGNFGGFFVSVSTILFALTTILGWSYYGESCVWYLSSGSTSARNIYRAVFSLTLILGATLASGSIWEISDMFNGMMMVPNLIAVILLSHHVKK